METISDAVAGICDLEFGTPNATNQMAVNDAVGRSIEFRNSGATVTEMYWR